jgi:hypothetical protein
MAAAVLSACTPVGYCNRLEQFGRSELLRIGTDGSGFAPNAAETTLGITAGSIASQALALALDGFVTFEFTMAADTNTAGVFDLTAKGVDFLTVGCSRKVEYEIFVKADVDAALLTQTSLVACAATPIVYNLIKTVEAGGSSAAASVRDIGAGDLISTATVVPTATLSVSTANVILTLTGVTNIDTTWVVKVKVFPKVAHALVPTT